MTRNKVFNELQRRGPNATFCHSPRKDAFTRIIKEFEQEGLVSIHASANPYDPSWIVQRLWK